MPESTPITAARFSITVDGYEIASFSELGGIRTEIKTVEFIESGDKGLIQKNIPSNPVLAQITLKRAQTQDPQMWTWHEAARFGEMGDFVGEREFSGGVRIGRTRMRPCVDRVVFSFGPFAIDLPPERVGFDEVAQRMVGPLGLDLLRQGDSLVGLARVHQANCLTSVRRNVEPGRPRFSRHAHRRGQQYYGPEC